MPGTWRPLSCSVGPGLQSWPCPVESSDSEEPCRREGSPELKALSHTKQDAVGPGHVRWELLLGAGTPLRGVWVVNALSLTLLVPSSIT